MKTRFTPETLALSLIGAASNVLSAQEAARIILIDDDGTLVHALELACHALGRAYKDADKRDHVGQLNVHLCAPKRVEVETDIIGPVGFINQFTYTKHIKDDGWSSPGDRIDLVIVAPTRQRGWASRLLQALPARRVLIYGWGADLLEHDYGRDRFKYGNLSDARCRLLDNLSKRDPSDDDLALLALYCLNSDNNAHVKEQGPLPSMLVVPGSEYTGRSKVDVDLNERFYDAMHSLWGDGLSDHARPLRHFLANPTEEKARRFALWVLSSAERYVYAARLTTCTRMVMEFARTRRTPAGVRSWRPCAKASARRGTVRRERNRAQHTIDISYEMPLDDG